MRITDHITYPAHINRMNRIDRISHTNCTAQGGGGSFKDRKPIGEVSCCESWMAERTDGPKGR